MGWGLLSPTLIILFITGLLPFFYVLYVGFHDWNVFGTMGMSYSGANNYRRLVFDNDFLLAIWNTLKFAFWAVGSELVLGFVLAQTLTRDFPGKTFFRTIHSLPLMVAPIAVGAVWRLLNIPGFGPVPYFLDKWFGYEYSIGKFASQAFVTTVLMDIWHWTPFVTLTLLAGLTTLPREPMEQAMNWLAHYQRYWTEQLDRLAAFLEEEDKWPASPASPSSAASTPRRQKSTRPGRSPRK